MKKILFLALFSLTACMQNGNSFIAPSEKINNPKCEKIISIEVFQVLDDFALANACTKKYDYIDGCKEEHVVYLAKEKGKIYFDEQKIEFPDGKCPVYTGTYTYTTKQEFDKTVPKVKFADKKIKNPAYENWLKEQSKKENK